MATKYGGHRRTLTYKVSSESALSNTVIPDLTGSASTLYTATIVAGGADVYVKFYDAIAVTLGTTIPLMGIYAKASLTTTVQVPEGIPFATGISLVSTSGDADGATTASPGATCAVTLVTT